MKDKRKSTGSRVMRAFGIIFTVLFLLMFFTGLYATSTKIPKTADNVEDGSYLKGEYFSSDKDYRMELMPYRIMFTINDKLFGMIKIKQRYYCLGTYPDAAGNETFFALLVEEGTGLFDKMQAMINDPSIPYDDLKVDGYFSVKEMSDEIKLIQDSYESAKQTFKDELGQNSTIVSKLVDSGKLFTFLGYTEEEYLANKKRVETRSFLLGMTVSAILLLLPAILFFILASVLRKRFRKRLAAEAASAPAPGEYIGTEDPTAPM